MAGQTIAEKILSRRAGKLARAGETVIATIDLAMTNDGSGPLALRFFKDMAGQAVFDPDKIIIVLDHYVPCPNDKVAALQDSLREFCSRGWGRLLELGEGICHQLLPEKGYILPGNLIVGGDSHSTTYGAFNALGTGIGSSDLAAAMISGKLWFRVPETIKVVLNGELQPRVCAKDLALFLVGKLGADGATYRALEFAGTGVAGLSISDRMTVCNMMVETGAKCALMPPDSVLAEFFGELPSATSDALEPDRDAEYTAEITVDLASLGPMIALPHQVDSVVPLAEGAGIPVHMGVLGTCTNGRLQDFRAALDVMGDGVLAPGFELLIVPASRACLPRRDPGGLG